MLAGAQTRGPQVATLGSFLPTTKPIRRLAMAAETKKDSNASDFNPFRDLTKTFEQFKMPGVDMNSFVDARRKDVEALVAANKITPPVACGAVRLVWLPRQARRRSRRGDGDP
jgi:hypothetical protein